jgi:dinuclear metal center YbgI/SA1388 family protein
MKLKELVEYLDGYLRVREITDSSQNGLQVQGPEEVNKVACAVDCCQAAINRAVAARAQLLFVHHGMLWEQPLRLVGARFQYVKTLMEGGCGLYGAHLPLDMHPEVGNNAELVRLIGMKEVQPFGMYKGNYLGFSGALEAEMTLAELVRKVKEITGTRLVQVHAYGPKKPGRVAVVSGGAASMIEEVEAAGCDTYITGETSHSYFHQAAERKMNVLFGGHYATETLGLKAVARHLQEKFGLETVFLDIPTGV